MELFVAAGDRGRHFAIECLKVGRRGPLPKKPAGES
jgi:hypothetical protein